MESNNQNENVRKAIAVLGSLKSGNPEAITSYIHPDNYVQHNLSLKDGREAMLGSLDHLKEVVTEINIKRTIADGDYVAFHSEYHFFGPKIVIDVFRFEDGLIVEHWDNLQEMVEKTPSNHTMIDGPDTIKDVNKTNENKEYVKGFVENIMVGKNPDLLTSYFDGDHYIQHSPHIADGLSGMGDAIHKMEEQNIEFQYTHVHKVIGQGDFVLAISEGHFDGQHTAFFDLFRVENGKIAEHWDVLETIPPMEKRANSNGRF